MMRAMAWLERLLAILGVVGLGWAGTTWLDARMFQQNPSAMSSSNGALTGPIGRLEIPRLAMSVVVMPGDDDATLSRAVGHLPDTPLPWNGGNTALAGHRDTFFEPLQRVKAGDDIHLETPRGRFQYRVRRTIVVEPEDLWVLDPTPAPTLTLITCYPFRYVGPAPKRFIVQADRV